MNYARILIVASLVIGALTAHGQDFAQKAESVFNQGNYAEAEKIYIEATTHGSVNGHLYYNLAVTAYRQSKLGEAMAAFLAARRYLPRDPDVAANLKFVESRIKDRLESRLLEQETGPLAFWHRMARACTVKELAYITAILSAVWGIGMLLGLLWRRAQFLLPYLWYAVIIPVFAAALFVTGSESPASWGAVTEKAAAGTKVYSGPSSKESALFELHEGAPVLVRGPMREGFWPIELSDGKKGWISSEAMRVWM